MTTALTASDSRRSSLYQQLVQTLRQRIESGQLRAGEAAPSESQLIAEFRVSSTTARRCLNELAQSGLVRRVQGKGTFVTDLADLVAHAQVGVLYHDLLDLTDGVAASELRGINQALASTSFQPLLLPLGGVGRSGNPAAALRALVRRHELQGLMLLSPVPPAWLTAVLDDGLPVVAVNFRYDDPRVDCVCGESASGITRLVRRCAEMGHRRLVLLRGAFDPQLVREVGMMPTPVPEVAGVEITVQSYRYFQTHAVRPIVEHHLAQRHAPTAFVCWGYEAALETAAVVRDRGWQIPHDISIVFFGVPTGPSQYTGEIVPIADIACCAAERLLARVQRQQPAPTPPFSSTPQAGITLGPAKSI